MSYRNNEPDTASFVIAIVAIVFLIAVIGISLKMGSDFMETFRALFATIFVFGAGVAAKIFYWDLQRMRWSTLMLLQLILIWPIWWPVFGTMSSNPFEEHWLTDPWLRWGIEVFLWVFTIYHIASHKPHGHRY